MTNGELAFISLAEEKNFTRAAEKLYVSQQGLSDHIKRLEKEYDTVLVNRKPEVSLTDSGEALYYMLLKKHSMEEDVKRVIQDIDKGETGEVRIGISSSRVHFYASPIVQKFHEKHPDVKIRVISDITFILMDLLEKGVLDFVIGVNPVPRKDFITEQVFEDRLFMVVPKRIAKEYTGPDSEVNLKAIKNIPLIRDVSSDSSVSIIDQYLSHRNIQPDNIIEINDEDERAELCSKLGAAMFCSGSFASFRSDDIGRKGLRVLSLKGLRHSVSISLVSVSTRTYPKCVTDMMDISREYLRELSARLPVEDSESAA